MTGRRLELDDLYRIPMISDPRLSPDGRRVAFVVTTADRDKDRNRSAIWIADVDGSAPPRPFTIGDNDSSPRWSPDGGRLAFVRPHGDPAKPQIWVMPAGGGEGRAVTSLKGGAHSPAWSPDGTRIAILSPVDGSDSDSDSDSDSGDAARDNRPVVVTTVQYKSDGSGLLGEKRLHLFVCDPDGDETTQLTSGDASAGPASWSPDGRRLTFASARHEGRDLDLASHVFVVDAGGGSEPVPVTSGLTQAASPAFSPDGRSIVHAGAPHVGVGHARLLAVASDGGPPPVELAPDLDRNVMIGGPAYPGAPPVFLPDGRSVLFCARDGGCTHAYRAQLDGPTSKVVGDECTSVAGLSMSADGTRIAFVLSTPESCGEVWVAGADGSGARPVTNLVGEALEGVAIVQPQPRRFEAPDGTAIEGWLVRDPGAAGNGTAGPLLLDVHGGPHNAWNPTFDGVHLYHQILAGDGWTILIVNPRGSDGYGESFYTGLVKDGWGRADADDFLAAVDTLVAEGVADPSRLAIAGYSYGGYMTCWLTATTDRFAAAVAGGVVCDLAAFAGTSDVGIGFARTELGVLPWEDPERVAASSPSSFVDGVRTPTLIVHGERDERCPVGQAEQWFSALRALGVETQLVRYPGASHLFVLNGPPSQRIDWCRRIVDWVEART